MAQSAVFQFEGKEFSLWSEDQLSRLNRETLKNRAMDLRDHVGRERLPPMPHHPEGLQTWILEVQDILTGNGAPASFDPPGSTDHPGAGRSSRGGGQYVNEDAAPLDDAQRAYVDAKRAGDAARERNRGGGMADVFGS